MRAHYFRLWSRKEPSFSLLEKEELACPMFSITFTNYFDIFWILSYFFYSSILKSS